MVSQPHVSTSLRRHAKTAPPHLPLSLAETDVHMGEPVFDAELTEGGREGGVKMDRGEGGER